MKHVTRRGAGVRSFARQYLEMVAAMVVGMVTLFPLWTALVVTSGAKWIKSTEVEALAMTTAMTVPMVGWMVVCGHGVAVTVEMSVAMYAGFVTFFPLLWSNVIDRAALLGFGHVAMLLLMALVMVRRAPRTWSAPDCITSLRPGPRGCPHEDRPQDINRR